MLFSSHCNQQIQHFIACMCYNENSLMCNQHVTNYYSIYPRLTWLHYLATFGFKPTHLTVIFAKRRIFISLYWAEFVKTSFNLASCSTADISEELCQKNTQQKARSKNMKHNHKARLVFYTVYTFVTHFSIDKLKFVRINVLSKVLSKIHSEVQVAVNFPCEQYPLKKKKKNNPEHVTKYKMSWFWGTKW